MSNPLEADMAWAVKFEKDDFIGREALKQVADRGYRNRMVGFVMENGAVPEDGTVILEHGWPVGKVTSSRFSPSIGKGSGWPGYPTDSRPRASESRFGCRAGSPTPESAMPPSTILKAYT